MENHVPSLYFSVLGKVLKKKKKVFIFPGGSLVKNLPANAGDMGLTPDLRNGKPFQYSCLENSTDRGAWGATVHGVAE